METTPTESEQYLNAEDIFALARQFAEGFTQAEMAEELSQMLGKEVKQSAISQMLSGKVSLIKMAMAWIECRWPFSPEIEFERDSEKEPVKYYKFKGPKIISNA